MRRMALSACFSPLFSLALFAQGVVNPPRFTALPAQGVGAVSVDGGTGASIQAAIDAASAAGGGTVFIPKATYTLTEAGGATILLRDKVWLQCSPGALFSLSGAFTDSVFRSANRDNNNVNESIGTGIVGCSLQVNTSSTILAVYDLTGMRNSTFRDLYLNGGGPTLTQTAWRLADRNPAGTSHKTCFFNLIDNVIGGGAGWGTWIQWVSIDGNANSNWVTNLSTYSKRAIDSTGTVNSSFFATFANWYAVGSASSSFFSGPRAINSVFYNVNGEDWTTPSGLSEIQTDSSGSFGTLISIGLTDFSGASAATAVDVSVDPFIVAKGNFSVNGSLGVAITMRLDGAFTAFATHGLHVAPATAYVFAVTNTGMRHTEYLLLNTEASNGPNSRIICSTSAPTASQLLIGTIAVNASGAITAYVDNQNNVVGPSIGSTRVKMLGSAQPTCSSTITGQFWYSGHSTGVKDSVSVCAADATDAYAWRTIY